MDRSFPVGPIRPPSEASSLLLQVTQGCTWNKCKFCVVYRGQNFHVMKPEEIKHNIDNMAYFRDLLVKHAENGLINKETLYADLEKLTGTELQCFYMVYNWLMAGGRSVFLQDGDSVALKPEKLAEVLTYLREKFPQIERVTTYGRASTLAHWSVDQLKLLREAGLDRIHTGFESGSDKVLQMINKGLTSEQQIDAGRKVKAAGMELSVYFMPGIGGAAFTGENAEQTARVVNEIDPDFVRLRTFVLKKESEMYDMKLRGEFVELTDRQRLKEIRDLISLIERENVQVVSDHIVNLIGSLNGRIGTDRQRLLDMADVVLGLPEQKFRLYQLARRYGYIENYGQLALVPGPKMEHFRVVADRYGYGDDSQWEEHMNDILRQYV